MSTRPSLSVAAAWSTRASVMSPAWTDVPFAGSKISMSNVGPYDGRSACDQHATVVQHGHCVARSGGEQLADVRPGARRRVVRGNGRPSDCHRSCRPPPRRVRRRGPPTRRRSEWRPRQRRPMCRSPRCGTSARSTAHEEPSTVRMRSATTDWTGVLERLTAEEVFMIALMSEPCVSASPAVQPHQ